MRVLLVGNQGLQHALAIRLGHEGCRVDVYPGQDTGEYNAVTSETVLQNDYDLVVLGSNRFADDPLVEELRQKSFPFFGPNSQAAKLESSKAHFKSFASSHHIPTPSSRAFTSVDDALDHVARHPPPYVVKADGLMRGCGVAVCCSQAEAYRDIISKLTDHSSPYFSERILIEEFVEGFEVGVNVLICDEHFAVLPPTKPHKRRNEGDVGPMVRGMGSVAPIMLNQIFFDELRERILLPTLAGLKRERRAFRGCLFINLMLTRDSVVVLEYNCRMGDPAMLVDLLLLDCRLSSLLLSVAQGRLAETNLTYRQGAAAAVSLCDPGYPGSNLVTTAFEPAHGSLIAGDHSGIVVAGASRVAPNGPLMVNDGVIATAIAFGTNLASAKFEATRLAQLYPNLHYRRDIGDKVQPPSKYEVVV